MNDPRTLDSNFGRTLSAGTGPGQDLRDPHGDHHGHHHGHHQDIRRAGVDALKHPMLRLVANPDRVPEAFASFGEVMRIALDSAQSRADRLDACETLRQDIHLLRMDPGTATQMLRELFDAVALDLNSPLLDELRLWVIPFDEGARACDVLDMRIPVLPPEVKLRRMSRPDSWIDALKGSVKRMLASPVSDFALTIPEAQSAIRLTRVFIVAHDHESCNPEECLNGTQKPALGLWVELERKLRTLGADASDLDGLDAEARLGLMRHLAGEAEQRRSKAQASRVKASKASGSLLPGGSGTSSASGSSDLAESTAEVPAGMVRVIKAPIPPCHGKEEQQNFERYEVLRQPLALPPMPDAQQLRAVFAQLEREFPWATLAIQRVARQLTARQRAGSTDFAWSPLLLVGPPGCGKSRLAQRLASLLGLLLLPVSLAGAHDVKVIQGSARAWGNSQPSPLVQFMLTNKSPRFVVLLDELDKIGHNWGYATMDAALLPLLERETAANLTDTYLQVPCDMSRILYVATANDMGPISMPLLSRFSKVEVPEPKREHFPAVASLVLEGIAEEWGVPLAALGQVDTTNATTFARNIRELRQMLIDTAGSNLSDAPSPSTDSTGSSG